MDDERYTYQNAGFNGFLNKGIGSRQGRTLKDLQALAPRKEINFDMYQTSGSLGDKVQVGGVVIDGPNSRILIRDRNGVEVGWIGVLDA